MDTYSSNEALVRRFFDAMSGLDSDGVEAVLAPTASYLLPFAPEGLPTAFEGREEFAGFVRLAHANAEPLSPGAATLLDVVVSATHGDPNVLFAQWRSEFRIPAVDAIYRNSYVGRFTIANALIAEFIEWQDSVKVVLTFGGSVTPPPNVPSA